MDAVTTRSRGERGTVLLFAAILGVLAMGIWVLAWRSTHDAIRVERFTVRRESRSKSTTAAVAAGVSLLRTGKPSFDPYEAIFVNQFGTEVKLTFTTDFDGMEWSIEGVLATDGEAATLPALPESFGS